MRSRDCRRKRVGGKDWEIYGTASRDWQCIRVNADRMRREKDEKKGEEH